ncbi:hypothetical protein ACFL0Q_07310 [Thermodesulfobacteriota bacterium]
MDKVLKNALVVPINSSVQVPSYHEAIQHSEASSRTIFASWNEKPDGKSVRVLA